MTPRTIAGQSPLSMECSRQEYWSGLPFPSPGDLPNPGMELESLSSPALAGRIFTTSATVSHCNANLNGMQKKAFLSHFVGHKGRSARLAVLVHLGCYDKTS